MRRTLLIRLLCRRRSKTRSALSAGHDPTEQIVRPIAEGRRGALQKTRMLRRAADCGSTRVASAGVELVTKVLDLFLVPVAGG